MSRIAASCLGLLALTAACGGSQANTDRIDVTEGEVAGAPDVTVQVINHAFRDASVFMYVGSSRHRLGIAVGKQTTVFKVPWRQFSRGTAVVLTADPIGRVDEGTQAGAVDIRSDTFTLQPGNTAVWTLESQLVMFEGSEAPGQSNVLVY
ncbi:MAG TPA: hypothetical protein VKB80_28385 [Kofleriaceae bacterium]|nr:hypothetical protein [Kofleriaceae bacterium]